MKCPQCGFVTSEWKRQCEKCGTALPKMPKLTTPSPSSPEPPPPQSSVPQPEVPEWRKEVTQKVKAYGERKRTLLTPPRPWKENPEQPVELAPTLKSELPPPPSNPEPPPIGTLSSAPLHQKVSAETFPQPSGTPIQAPRAEIWNTDLQELEIEPEAATSGGPVRLYLGRRAASLLVDHTILIILYSAVLYSFSYLIEANLQGFVRSSWPALLGVFLLVHCLYYVYFYSTSRQTPGQVFFVLEVRDPLSSHISLQKILIRWLAMVGLNFLNLFPLFDKRKPLLLDQISKTEIRSLR